MKQALCFMLVFFALISAASALYTDIRESYNQGETMVIEISGVVLQPIQPSQVEFLRGHVPVVFEYDIKRLGNRYFIYAITPFLMNNYTLVIKDVETMLNGQTAQQDLRQNFSTTNQTAPYAVRPGFILTGNDFSLAVALNRDQPENIIVSAG